MLLRHFCALRAFHRRFLVYRGEMDELFLADRALAPQEIRQLMNRNQPMRMEPLAAN